MGLFNSFKSLTKAVVDTALLPVDVARDVITMGGILEDEDKPHTVQRLDKVVDKLQDAYDEIDED